MTTSQKLRVFFHAHKPTKAQAGAVALIAAPASIALAEVATQAVINPAAVAITSASAEAATGSATVATATGTGAVAALTTIPATFIAGIAMLWRGCGLLGDRKLASKHAEKVLEQKLPDPTNRRSTIR
jgi:hypothetical protein